MARAAETHERIGHLHRKLKQYDDAIAAYQKAQAKNPERGGRLNFNLAQLCLEQKRLEPGARLPGPLPAAATAGHWKPMR